MTASAPSIGFLVPVQVWCMFAPCQLKLLSSQMPRWQLCLIWHGCCRALAYALPRHSAMLLTSSLLLVIGGFSALSISTSCLLLQDGMMQVLPAYSVQTKNVFRDCCAEYHCNYSYLRDQPLMYYQPSSTLSQLQQQPATTHAGPADWFRYCKQCCTRIQLELQPGACYTRRNQHELLCCTTGVHRSQWVNAPHGCPTNHATGTALAQQHL